MKAVLTNDAATNAYLEWLGKITRDRYLRSVQNEEDMGRHSHPDDVDTDGSGSYISDRRPTEVLRHAGYQCETCRGYWAALEPVGADTPEELPCLATEGCEGPVVALYPTDEPVPEWIPVIIQGGQA